MISSAVRKAGPFAGAGSTGPYTFAFKVFTSADLYVVKLDVATGVETVLTLTTHYTVSLNANQNNNPGGTITLISALAVGYNLTISSKLADLQPVDITNQGGFYPSVQNDALDRLTILIQQADEKLDRSIKYPISDPSTGATLPAYAQRASTVLAFDSSGAPVAGPAVASVGTVLANIANINTVAGISANVTTVAGISANVTTVAGIDTEVTTVAGISANVTTVVGNTTNINKVAAIDTDVSTVAAVDTDVSAVAAIDTEIVAVAANVADVTNFADVYYGPAAADPATRKDSSPLQGGDLYFNTAAPRMRVYDAGAAAWIDAGIIFSPTIERFSGNSSDDDFTLSADPGTASALIVSISGIVQVPTIDYTVSGTTLTFTTPPPSGTNNIAVQSFGSAGTINVPAAGSVGTSAIASSAYATAAEITTGTEAAKVIAPDQLALTKYNVGYATAAEITTGTEAAKAIAPDQLKLSSPTFANITDSGLTASQMVCTDANKKLVSKAFEVPVGAEMLWPSETVPEGWLEEDGSSLVRATYPALFALIGTMYGAADGTHFNLPDMRGKFPRIWAHGQTTDPDRATRTAPTAPGATISAGDHVGTNQTDDYKAHTHDAKSNSSGGGGVYVGTTTGTSTTQQTGTAPTSGGNETRPVNTYRMMIIKAY